MRSARTDILNRLLVIAWFLLGVGAVAAWATPSTSSHYTLEPSAVDYAGGMRASLHYSQLGSADFLGSTNVVSAHFDLASGYVGAVSDLLEGNVPGFYVFYNNSAWDGSNAAANADDDNAIAPDKVPLLPGQTATFANYTSYSRGINGIMIDLAALPGTLTASDFVFKVGNDANLANWPLGPAPSSITVRTGAGARGSDRITLLWADGAIKKQWLEVRVKATPATGLATDEVFFFGNAIGDIGDAPAPNKRVRVNTIDLSGVRLHPRNLINNPAPIIDPYDFDRDRRVNKVEQSIVRLNPAGFVDGLLLISPGSDLSLLSFEVKEPQLTALDVDPEGISTGTLALHVITSRESEVQIEVQGTANAEFRLETTDDLGFGMWRRVPDAGVRSGQIRRWQVPVNLAVQHQFFRLALKADVVP